METTDTTSESHWLDKKFLENILKERLDNDDVEVLNYTIRESLGQGESYLSTMIRVDVHYRRVKSGKIDNIPMIIKTLPQGESLKDLVSRSSIFSNEIRMYTDTIPKLCELYRNYDGTFDMSAEFYYLCPEKPIVLVIEDLSTKGFKMANRKEGLDLDHCILAMKCLARIHAVSFMLHSQDPPSVEVYKSNFVAEKPSDVFFYEFISTSLTALASVVKSLFPENVDYPERLLNRIATLRKDQRNVFLPEKGGFNVLIHGDLWVNNMMFRYDKLTGHVAEVKFVDFQFCCYASAAVDLQYFIHTSPTEEVRVHNTDTLLKTYHSELVHTMNFLGYHSEILSFSQLLEEYEKKMVFGFFTTTVVLPTFLADEDDDFSIDSVIRKENLSKGHLKRLNNPLFTNILKRLLPIFAEKGIF